MENQPIKTIRHTYFIAAGIIIVSLVSIIAAGFFYYRYNNLQKKLANPEIATNEELDAVLSKVNKLIELPGGETPQLATVIDKDKIGDQPFFEKAQVGDKVLVYPLAKKAYLYRPSTNKIINVGPVNITSPTPTPTNGDDPTAKSEPNVLYTATAAPSPTDSITSTPTPTPTP